ncbi:MAG: glycosyltransferase [Algicola sp.]|nr:glycosyltransferase [Algicola sp.]
MEYCTHFLAKHLNEMDAIQASVACGTLRGVPPDFEYPYPCYRAKSFSFLTPWLAQKNREQLVKKEKIQVFHGQMLHGGGYDAMRLSQQFDLPFVAQSHGADVQTVSEIIYGALNDSAKKHQIKEVLKNADRLIAVSSLNKQHMVDLGAQPDRIDVVFNGIAIKEMNAIPFHDLRPQLGLKPEDFVLISVGRNKPIKRMEMLFEALKKLKDYTSIKCMCVGPKQHLETLAQKYGVTDKVVLVGSIPENHDFNDEPPYPDLINAYRSANVFVSCSYVEAFSCATADALACGIPVIIGKCHGVKDVVKDGETGLVMQKESADELAQLILQLYEDRSALKSNEEQIKHSIAHLSWEHISKQMAHIYKALK